MPFELFKTFSGNEVITAILASIVVTVFFVMTGGKSKVQAVNPGVKKDQPKVVDTFTIGDLEDMCKKNKDGVVALCRCWRSSNFPLCDGTHNSFNKTCGENVGPCLVKRK